jgi:hypothetical protein
MIGSGAGTPKEPLGEAIESLPTEATPGRGSEVPAQLLDLNTDDESQLTASGN